MPQRRYPLPVDVPRSPVVPRAALLAAVREADDGATLVAVLPVGGRTLIERQARLAVQAGAAHLVVLVERVPAGLTAAIDRLRRDGLRIEVARSAGDAADRFHPDEHVLVFADGALAGEPLVRRLGEGTAPALLTLGETMPDDGFERIDAATRWTGIAMVPGDFLRRTVAMLGDWDLHSTLLRRAAGAGARRVDVADRAGLGEPEPAILVRSGAGARLATQTMLDRRPPNTGWADRFVLGPVSGLFLPLLLERPVEARWLRLGGLALTVIAVALAWTAPLLVALAVALLGAMLVALARRLDAVRAGVAGEDARLELVRAGLLAALLVTWATRQAELGHEPLLFAAGTIAAMAALARERRSLAQVGGQASPLWLADPDALALVLALFAAASHAVEGVAALLLYAAISFAIVQHRLAQGLAAR